MSRGDEVFKADRLRLMAKSFIEMYRKGLLERIRLGQIRALQGITEAKVRGLHYDRVWKACEFELRANGILPEDCPITMPALVSIALGRAVPFIFKDKELVQDIIDSKIGGIPANTVKLPFDEFVIELPCLLDYPDGTGDQWDVVCVRSFESEKSPYPLNDPRSIDAEISNQSLEKEICWSFICYNTSKNFKTNYFYFSPKDNYVFRDNDIEGMEHRPEFGRDDREVVGSVITQILKLVFFLISPSCITDTVVRQCAAKKAPPVVKGRYRKATIVSMSKERTSYEYEEPSEESGRHLTCRFRVVGHFKNYTKGRLAGRVLWCPPHWKGPEVGAQVEKKYVVDA